MPLRPFPLPISIGTDICRVPRIHNLISRPNDANYKQSPLLHFMRRFLTHREQSDFWAKFGTVPSVADKKYDAIAMHLAGRWAAKEAVIKAVRHRQLKFMDVEILRSKGPDGSGGIFALIRDTPGSPVMTEENGAERREVPLESTGTQNVLRFGQRKGSKWSASPRDEPPEPEPASLEEMYGELEGQVARVSISHDTEYATAMCLAAEEPMEGDVGGEAVARMP